MHVAGVRGGTALIGVDLGGTKCHSVLAEAGGAVVCQDWRRTAELPDPADVVLAGIGALRAQARARGLEIAAVAVGVPGFVDPVAGRVVGAANLPWEGAYDLRGRLRRDLPEPCGIENDVNLAALGEARVGAGRGAGSFVTLALGTGLGGAVVVDGRVLRGAHGAAGEFGLLLADRGQLAGRTAGMESLVGGRGVAARARALAAGDPAATELDPRTTDAADVFAAAGRGDPVAGAVLEEVLEHVAMAVVDVCAVVDPELVVLDGSIGRALAPRLPRLGALVATSLRYPPRLAVSALAPSAALAGAVTEAARLAGLPG